MVALQLIMYTLDKNNLVNVYSIDVMSITIAKYCSKDVI